MPMSRFHVAVLVGLADIDAVTSDAIMSEQGLVLFCEFLVTGKVIYCRGKAVAADSPGHAACGIQGILKTRRQRFERLRVAEVYVFPVGISENGMEQHVVVRTSPHGDPQVVQNDEVESDHVPRMMNLREVNFLFHPRSAASIAELAAPTSVESNR